MTDASVSGEKSEEHPVVAVDFALQGGGAHGAFTWGVLDRLLEEERLRIDGISGTSAGAMNAAVLADGYIDGGPDGARKALEAFWAGVSRSARFSPFQRVPLERPGYPRSARDILNRLNEVSFNAVLLKELRMIALLRQLAQPGDCEGAQWAGMRLHMVRNPIMA